MRPLQYHEAQRAVQREANSTKAADSLSTWVGPVTEYAVGADIIVLASVDEHGALRTAALSGPSPLVTAESHAESVTIRAPRGLKQHLSTARPWGGIVINPATARRSRIAGVPTERGELITLSCPVAFTNCRKYILASRSTGDAARVGPESASACELADPWVTATIANGETAFLASLTPDGVADVSHRGGKPGFLRYDPVHRSISWTEYLGDGMFVSVGNLRADPRFVLLVLELETGDAVRIEGEARYENVRTDRHERVDALIQANEPFPVQGKVTALVRKVERLTKLCWPRERVEERARITSADRTSVQHPQ